MPPGSKISDIWFMGLLPHLSQWAGKGWEGFLPEAVWDPVGLILLLLPKMLLFLPC